jgi:hypothetical protein
MWMFCSTSSLSLLVEPFSKSQSDQDQGFRLDAGKGAHPDNDGRRNISEIRKTGLHCLYREPDPILSNRYLKIG